MRKLNHRDLRNRALRAITVIEDLQWIADHADHIARLTNDHLDDGLKGRNYDGDGRGGAELTSVEAHVDRRLHVNDHGHIHLDPDSIWETVTRLLGTLDLTTTTARSARTLASKLTIATTPADRKQQSSVAASIGTAGSGHCMHCNTWCPGTSTDRLRAGRCEPCYRYRLDHHGNERPSELWSVKQ